MYVNSTLNIIFTREIGRSVSPADPFKSGTSMSSLPDSERGQTSLADRSVQSETC